MAATITYSSSRVTISGSYKSFTGSSTSSVVTFSSGEAPAAGDVGRKIWWLKGGTSATAEWQCRDIINATATTVTCHDNWVGVPTAGDTFRISSIADDILAAQPTAGSKTGSSSFAFAGDLELTSGATFSSSDESIEWTRDGITAMFPLATGTAICCGTLWGGEGSGRQTTNGSRWSIITSSGTSLSSLYSTSNARAEAGAVVNLFGCLIESGGTSKKLFQRMTGPARFIGCVMDGVMGGRFYHEYSEWIDCRMSGNTDATPAWSIGATFLRDIDTIFFYRNLMAMKSFEVFGGTLRNVTFADNNDIFNRDGDASSVFNFIDCSEFTADLTDKTGGTLNQFRSVNLLTTTSDGTPLDGVGIRINDKNDTTQGTVQFSSGGGFVDEILALRFQQTHGSTTMTGFAPYRIRQRIYGYRYISLNATIDDPIRQSSEQTLDPNVTQSSSTAASHTGITLTDHGGSPVSWNGKNWGITVTCDLTVNPSLNLDDLKHYLYYVIGQDSSIGGKASGFEWHDLLPIAGTITQADTYGAVTKGVRIIDQSGNPFPGVTRMQSDDETYYDPPITYSLTISDLQSGSDVVIMDASITPTGDGTNVLQTFDAIAGTTVVYNYTFGDVSTINIGIFKSGFKPKRINNVTLVASSSSIPGTQEVDLNYA